MTRIKRFRAADRLYHDRGRIDVWVRDLKGRLAAEPKPLMSPIQEFKDMVADDPALNLMIWTMFKEAALLKHQPRPSCRSVARQRSTS